MALPGNIRVLTGLSQAQEPKNHGNDHHQSNQIIMPFITHPPDVAMILNAWRRDPTDEDMAADARLPSLCAKPTDIT